MCLQNALQDSNKSLQPDCYKMLTTRMEMFKNAAKVCKKSSNYSNVIYAHARIYIYFLQRKFSEIIHILYIIFKVDRAKYYRGALLDGKSFPSAALFHDHWIYPNRDHLYHGFVLRPSD